MPAAQKDLLIKQGDSFEVFLRVREKTWDPVAGVFVPGAYVDLTGKQGKAQIKVDPTKATPVTDFAVVIPDQAITANRGSVIMRLTPLQTAALTPSIAYPSPSYVYDMELSDAAGDAATWRKTYLEGGVAVKAQVTK